MYGSDHSKSLHYVYGKKPQILPATIYAIKTAFRGLHRMKCEFTHFHSLKY
ncbi:Protein of unknown function [Gryllus bimaculatus]|nr:Protein of unknown function [Gryllus bimaculatus]